MRSHNGDLGHNTTIKNIMLIPILTVEDLGIESEVFEEDLI